MKSSRARSRLTDGLSWAVCLLSALAVSRIQPWLAERFRRITDQTDVYALPSPEQTVPLSLGYRAALADLLFAHVLVHYGIHVQEKRRFEFVGNYLDTIVELDPKYRDVYRYADTLLTIQAEAPRREDYAKARALMERGMAEFPVDDELWVTAGQFFAYVAPPRLEDEETRREWRLEGARRLARACELVSDNQNVPFNCIAAAGMLSREGEREAMIQFLQRVLAVNDDPEILKLVERAIRGYQVDRSRLVIQQRNEAFERIRRERLPHLGKDLALVLIPPFDAAGCAGVPPSSDQGCATSWRAWAARGP